MPPIWVDGLCRAGPSWGQPRKLQNCGDSHFGHSFGKGRGEVWRCSSPPLYSPLPHTSSPFPSPLWNPMRKRRRCVGGGIWHPSSFTGGLWDCGRGDHGGQPSPMAVPLTSRTTASPAAAFPLIRATCFRLRNAAWCSLCTRSHRADSGSHL